MKPISSISIVGTGNVAYQLGKALLSAGIEIADVFGRDLNKSEELAQSLNSISTRDLSKLEGDIVLCCVNDQSIETIAKTTRSLKPILHTSGSVSLNVLDSHQQFGVLYPLQSLSKNKTIDFKNVPFLIEGNTVEFTLAIKELAKKISISVQETTSDDRLKFHLAAVFVNNFTNHLVYRAKDILDESALNWELLLPLLKETVNKLEEIGPYAAQTGPAKRGDLSTIETHLALLEERDRKIYQVLTESIQNSYKTKSND